MDEEEGECAVILIDGNGDLLFETEDGGLWCEIIEQNDVALLNQYLTDYEGSCRWRADVYDSDPFFIAASSGSTDVLRVLLEYCRAAPDKVVIDDGRGPRLLHAACRGARPDTARFLLENEPVFQSVHRGIGTIQERDFFGTTALLAAAEWPTHRQVDGEDDLREEVMRLLLDRGASARDIVSRPYRQEPVERLVCTVLSSAVAWASYDLVKLLIDSGAEVHTKERHDYESGFLNKYGGGPNDAENVTPLHIGSYYSNTDGIRALLDHLGREVSTADMVLSRDSFGCLPLHRAAGGPGPLHGRYASREDQSIPSSVATIKLLLSEVPKTINSQDTGGKTPLHHSISTLSRYQSKRFDTAKFLCENGADVSLQDKKGQTPLHVLANRSGREEYIDMPLINLLLAHGARVDDADRIGCTPLHFIAQRLDHINAVRLLLRHGADVRVKDLGGDTPLHKAARGGNGYSKGKTVLEAERAQDEMMELLQAGGDASLMDQENLAGETPRQICMESRNRWLKQHEKGQLMW